MKKEFRISIKKPCSENFDSFKKTNCGGFCNSCKKEVIDFTKMNAFEISKYFKDLPQNTCGRFSDNQLKTYTNITPSKSTNKLSLSGTRWISFSLLSLLPFSYAQAQDQKIQEAITISESEEKIETSDATKPETNYLKGTVLDEEDAPLPGANVVLKNTAIGVSTDFDGNFTLSKSLEKGDILIFSYIGYKTQEIIIDDSILANMNLNIKMKGDFCILVGEVAVEGVYSHKKTFGQKLKGLFK